MSISQKIIYEWAHPLPIVFFIKFVKLVDRVADFLGKTRLEMRKVYTFSKMLGYQAIACVCPQQNVPHAVIK